MKFTTQSLLAIMVMLSIESAFADRVSKQKAREIVENGKLLSLMDHEGGNNWFRAYNLYFLNDAYFVCIFEATTKGYQISCNDMLPEFVN